MTTTEVTSGTAGAPEAATRTCEVAVVGGGIGGLAACIHLRRAGVDVVCIEPDPFPHDRVGESLDWSSPRLLAQLGVPRESLLADEVATLKRNIQIVATDRPPFMGQPEPWFARRPLGFETVTLHVDRVEMDRRLYELACSLGTEFLWERVNEIEAEEGRVTAVRTTSGSRIEARWFFDASGRGARLFARKFEIPRHDYGRDKVCFWTYFETPPISEGTTFYGDPSGDEYLTWIWEIPISPRTASIGCVMPAEFVRDQRRMGHRVDEILRDRLVRFPRFAELLERQPEIEVRSTSYRSYVYAHASGPNWLILGEAASLPDPLTANGVTAAFRHAWEGTSFLLESRHLGSFTARQRRIYDANLTRMGHVFNHSIEGAIYDWPIRWGLGVMPAQKVYTAFSYTINALYSKYRPKGRAAMLAFGLMLRGVWLWIETWSFLGRVVVQAQSVRRPRRLQTVRTG